jgi:hypothetical protein
MGNILEQVHSVIGDDIHGSDGSSGLSFAISEVPYMGWETLALEDNRMGMGVR